MYELQDACSFFEDIDKPEVRSRDLVLLCFRSPLLLLGLFPLSGTSPPSITSLIHGLQLSDFICISLMLRFGV
ncbi:hypothetical protein HanPI659440_Chr15g0601701 [Helianthus annuus]|nr:hypothetical protein HanPI659440_Chr15g0601701 [Helianthus annuus]